VAEDNRTRILDFAVAAIDVGGERAVRVHVTIKAAFGKSLPASDSDRTLNRRVEIAWYTPGT